MSHTLYRVENPETMQGLWYTGEGRFNAYIRRFGDALCHDAPMGFDYQFKTGGNWVSACDNLADMSNWFNLNDLQRLHKLGYDLYRIEVPNFRTINGHAAFLRESVTLIERAPLALICSQWEAAPAASLVH